MVVYLDTSAAVKLVVAEPETEALTRWLTGREIVANDLLRTELLRATRREAPDRMTRARDVLARVEILSVPTRIFERAAELDPIILPSLDALHLASALDIGDDLEAIVTYDDRLAAAAGAHGITVQAPSG